MGSAEALGEREAAEFDLDTIRHWEVDREEFQVENPQVRGSAQLWERRQVQALAPTVIRR